MYMRILVSSFFFTAQDKILAYKPSCMNINCQLPKIDSAPWIKFVLFATVLLKLQATQLESCVPLLDLSGEGLNCLPETLPTFLHVQELHLGRNRLSDGNLKILTRLPNLRSLHLSGNALRKFPTDLLQLFALTHLDLSDNSLTELPEDICCLAR